MLRCMWIFHSGQWWASPVDDELHIKRSYHQRYEEYIEKICWTMCQYRWVDNFTLKCSWHPVLNIFHICQTASAKLQIRYTSQSDPQQQGIEQSFKFPALFTETLAYSQYSDIRQPAILWRQNMLISRRVNVRNNFVLFKRKVSRLIYWVHVANNRSYCMSYI